MNYRSKFVTDYGILKRYGDGENIPEKYKLVVLRTHSEIQKKTSAPCSVNDEKLVSNLSRARQAIFELSYCNPWELFVTFTLDKKKYNRYDLKAWYKDLSQFLRNYRRLKGADIHFLLVPERHKDGAWHMHGFLMGLPLEHLRRFTLEERIPEKIRARILAGKSVFTWEAYARKFGFADIELIEHHEAVSKYVTKYITEDLFRSVSELGAHTYYSSRGLSRAEIVRREAIETELSEPDYANDYLAVKWIDDRDAAIFYFDALEALESSKT